MGDFLLLRCPMEEGEILFESNKKIIARHGGFLIAEMSHGGDRTFI